MNGRRNKLLFGIIFTLAIISYFVAIYHFKARDVSQITAGKNSNSIDSGIKKYLDKANYEEEAHDSVVEIQHSVGSKLKALTLEFQKSERGRSILLYSKQGEHFSGVGFLINRPDPAERKQMLSKIAKLKADVKELTGSDVLNERIEKLKDYAHWNVNPETNVEFPARLIQSVVTPITAVSETSDTILEEADSFEMEEDVDENETKMPTIISHGNSKTSFLNQEQTQQRYQHLFSAGLQ